MKILRITNVPTVSVDLDFMLQAKLYATFNQTSNCFFVKEVADCSEFPINTLEYLAEVLVEQKAVIIQWDLKRSAEYLVFYKKPGHSDFYALNSTETLITRYR